MIIFKSIKIKNFLSVGNSPIEINLNSHRKTLVVGANGAGKSQLLDAIVFALYGKPFRKTNKPNIINSINKCNLLIELFFSIGKREYKIVRGLKPNIFEIYCNDILINQDAKTKDYQEHLEKYILKVNYKSFINVIILGSARYNPFMGMSAADRRSIIEELLDIQIFSSMNLLVKDKLSKIKEEIFKSDYGIDVTNEKIDLQKQNINEHKKNTQDQIKKKQEEIDKSNHQIEKIQSDIILIEKHISILQEKIIDKTSVEKSKDKLISFESKLETNISKLKKDCAFYENNDNCPTCKQSIENEFKNKQIEESKLKQEKLISGLDKLNVDLLNIQNRLSEITSISKHITDHQTEIVRLNASVIAIQKYIQKELSTISEISSCVDGFEDTNDRLNDLLDQLEVYKKEKESFSTNKKYYDFVSLLLKDGGIKTRIIKQYLPIMNKLINAYLSQLNLFVNFNIDENFEEVIKSRYRDEFKYENFSEGEKLRIDLSILFTFRQIAKMKNSVNTNLLIFDETLDSSLDLNGIDQFLDLIESLDTNTNVIVISHRGDALGDRFDRTLKFEKKKNFTKMIEAR